MTEKVLVTGATGFVGSACVRALAGHPGMRPRRAVRSLEPDSQQDTVVVGEIGPDTDWGAALEGCRYVIHTAARVHVMQDKAQDPLAAFRLVNVEGTLTLARAAARAGVKRLVFVSSIKVNGEESSGIYTADDLPSPVCPYGWSKLEAEQGLKAIAHETGLEVVIIRPPLVYGPGVKGNFRQMLAWISRGIPLPLGAVKNRRSMVCLENLVDLMVHVLVHPAATNQVFLVSDGEDLSVPQWLEACAMAMQKPLRMPCISPEILALFARIVRKQPQYVRLCGSLRIDMEKTRNILGWHPRANRDRVIQETVQAFIEG